MFTTLGKGASLWLERKMPERWYELLRERMQVEELRMRVVKDGSVIEDGHLQDLLTEAHSLDGEMLHVMRQAIAEVWDAKQPPANRRHDTGRLTLGSQVAQQG